MQRKQTFILGALALAALSGSAPVFEPTEEPASVASAPEDRVTEYQRNRLVEAYAAETLIENRALAETVAEAIEDAAREFELNPWMLATLIRIESSGRPAIVSHAGAIGLTQILPGTAEEIADKLHLAEYDLRDPATNVRMGAFYLSRLLARFDGNEGAALAAYNYGPTAISRRLRNGEELPTRYATKILTRVASK